MADFFQALSALGQGLQGNHNMQSTPSALQELAAYQNMTPEQQQIYWNVKRAAPVVNLGGTQAILSPQGTGALTASLPVTPKPEDMPEFKKDVAQQSAVGKAVGETEGTEEKKYIQAPQIAELVQEAKALLPKATSGGAASDFKAVKEYFGGTTDASGIDSSLNVIGSKLTANVPRYEGPQSDGDRAEYKTAAGDVANSRKPVQARLDALDTIEKLNNKYLTQEYSQPSGRASSPTATTTAPSFSRAELEAELAKRGAK